ncbi:MULTISPECIES: M12 family metallo-peptidase [Chryseobacterium]|uniref:Secretion system C-terminal sorting domain-containing protein n=1 Tax=Chryseobacterium camelliae TaxID=1265445 RepID=A0ABU0TKH7_9FLAO|nr:MULTISPECIES: M12 family metallo-peptidase [Chryseobacterium]MDQ1097553.1 hypothetical protein [Chryseobacterium camelliae]MDQ1101482.1 hypothetical protein [Chryseobacterium sp. SORGH_AS_1048]MDR6129278.1 hypothetical protein [Chryseobacterium sp. SORGH_AS_1175]MDT3408592.1 hypothetical protein [Pseudacidovorax intermedius]
MKINFTAFVILFSTFLFAQNRLFSNLVNENDLNSNQKVSPGLASSYTQTKYYSQPTFDLKSDLQILLPTNKLITARFTRIFKYGNKSESYVYSIDNEPNAEFVLSRYNNIVTGMYSSGSEEKVVFHQTNGNIFAMSLVNESKIISQDSKDDYFLGDLASSNKHSPSICLETTPICPMSTIDVMVIYTWNSRINWGGTAQSNSMIATAITNFNISLLNSGITNVNINLVYSGETGYVESGDIATDLMRFKADDDGYMDDIHDLRTTFGADLCALVTAGPVTTCGLAYINIDPTGYSNTQGFSTTIYNCVLTNYTLAHELGHNMGLRHDRYMDTFDIPCIHQHGYINRTAINLGMAGSPSKRWRTLMTYNDECAANGFNCTKLNRWSNPNINYNLEPMGIPIGDPNSSDEAFAFSRFACMVANFMPSNSSLSTEENISNIKDFIIFPNPAKDEINVVIDGDKKLSFKIFNAIGQLVLTSENKKIDLTGISQGEYILVINDEHNVKIGSKKFIINKAQ